MPNPKKNEAKQDYLKRCTRQLVDKEGRKPAEAYAVCNSLWDKSKGEASLTLSAPVDLALEASDSERRSFLITAKTAAALSVWGETLYIDIDGIKTEPKLPILREHDRKAIVGHGSAFKDDHSLFIEGEFSRRTQTAKEVLELADEGYPWQASIGIWGEKIESLDDEKSKTKVNGQTVSGPALVWRESKVREVSFVTLGADDRTAAIALSEDGCAEPSEKEVTGMDFTELKAIHAADIEALEKAAHSAGYDAGYSDGVNAERARAVEILQAEADYGQTLTAVTDGTPAPEAYKAFFMSEKVKRVAALKEMASSAPPSVGAEPPTAPDVKKPLPVDQEVAVRAAAMAAERNIPYAEATTAVLREDPKLNDAYRAALNG